MWLVGIDRPYYPSVEFIEDETKAKEKYNELVKELKQDEEKDKGVEIATVFISKLQEKESFKTCY